MKSCGAWTLVLLLAAFALAINTAFASSGTIAFSTPKNGSWDIWTIAPTGQDLRQLTDTPKLDEHAPAWSHDGKRLAYSTSDGAIVVIDPATSKAREVARVFGHCGSPTWSADDSSIAYSLTKLEGGEVSETWQVKLHETLKPRPVRIIGLDRKEFYPAWSPRGNVLAFSRFHRDNMGTVIEELWFWNPETLESSEVTRTGADNIASAWSPDGSSIAFESNLGGNYDIWVMGIDQGTLKRLTTNLRYDGHPSWSPDGKQIAFVSSRSGSRQVWIMNQDGTEARQLTKGDAPCEDPCWSPGGQR